jgi:hypothetical protein
MFLIKGLATFLFIYLQGSLFLQWYGCVKYCWKINLTSLAMKLAFFITELRVCGVKTSVRVTLNYRPIPAPTNALFYTLWSKGFRMDFFKTRRHATFLRLKISSVGIYTGLYAVV